MALPPALQLFHNFLAIALGDSFSPQRWQNACHEYNLWSAGLRNDMLHHMRETLPALDIISEKTRDFNDMQTYIASRPASPAKERMDFFYIQLGKLDNLIVNRDTHHNYLQPVYNYYNAHPDHIFLGPRPNQVVLGALQSLLNSNTAERASIVQHQRAIEAQMEHIRRATPLIKARGFPPEYLRQKAKSIAKSRAHIWPIDPQPLAYSNNDVGTWYCAAFLGEGGMGKAWVWIKLDQHGSVIDRIVQKTALDNNPEWSPMAYKWHILRGLMPLEWITQTLAAQGQGAKTILKTVSYPTVQALADGRRHTRLYMQYAAHRDVFDVMCRHASAGSIVPEEFAWWVFLSMAEAAVIMKNGAMNGRGFGWEQIVHRDLKPDNIFLDVPDPSRFNRFPRPLVADFGLAFLTDEHDASNPTIWTEGGTLGYFATEQHSFVNQLTGDPIEASKILSPCNIFGMGAVMNSLMQGRMLTQNDVILDNSVSLYSISSPSWSQYSLELRTMVTRCTRPDPRQRPTPEQLLAGIKSQIDRRDDLKRVRDGGAPTAPVLHSGEEQRYQLGFAGWIPGQDGNLALRMPLRIVNPDP